jgi:hypothetical protein
VAVGTESLALRRAEEDRYGEAGSLACALLEQSRGIRQAIGDRAGVADCDARLARIAGPA